MLKFFINVTDKIPEGPYIILAFAYMLTKPGGDFVHLFSTAFFYLMLCGLVGAALKGVFKTKRPKDMHYAGVFKYGFPSMHTMISVGTITFTFFICPSLPVFLIPLGLFYMYARGKMRAHTKLDVAGGAFFGLIVGYITGAYIMPVNLGRPTEFMLAMMFFLIPLVASYYRIQSEKFYEK